MQNVKKLSSQNTFGISSKTRDVRESNESIDIQRMYEENERLEKSCKRQRASYCYFNKCSYLSFNANTSPTSRSTLNKVKAFEPHRRK